jgi:hypothetical protein
MSASTLTMPAAEPNRHVVPVLGRVEGRRLLMHPVMLVGFGFWLVMTISSQLAGTLVVQRWESVTSTISFFPGVLAILAAHMVTSRDRRAGSLDLLGATPSRAQERVLGLCVAALGPALVAWGLTLGLVAWYAVGDGLPVTPSIWHVSQGALTVLGGSLLGIMLGVWLPSRATPVIAMVAVVGVNVWLSLLDHPGPLFGPMVSWADWGPYDGSVWVRLLSGSAGGHVLYLLGLCGLAASAAFIRVADRRGFALGCGLVSLTTTIIGGLAQLP